MRTWKPLLVLLLAMAATELVSCDQDRDFDQVSYDVVRDDGGDDGEGDFDQIVTDAAKKVCELFRGGVSLRDVTLQKTKRGWGKKLWKKIKKIIPPVFRPTPYTPYGRRRYLTEALTAGDSQRDVTLQKTKRGWGTKLLEKIGIILPPWRAGHTRKRSLTEMRREDGNDCQDPETAEMVEAVGTLAAVTDMMASAEGCDAGDGE